MSVVQRGQQISHDAEDTIKREARPPFYLLFQVLSQNQFHHKVSGSLITIRIENTDDVVVLKKACSPTFRKKSRLEFFRLLSCKVVDQNRLDRDSSFDVGVERLIDRTHTTLPKELDDFVATKSLRVRHGGV